MACFRPVPYLGRDGCPVCAGRVIIPGENDMASLFPELAREWNPEKNGTLRPSQVTPRQQAARLVDLSPRSYLCRRCGSAYRAGGRMSLLRRQKGFGRI